MFAWVFLDFFLSNRHLIEMLALNNTYNENFFGGGCQFPIFYTSTSNSRSNQSVPRPARDTISPSASSICPGASFVWTCLKYLPRKVTMRDLRPSQLSPLNLEEQWPSLKPLLDVQSLHCISKSCHNAEETYFGHLCPRPGSFGHHPDLVTKRDSRNIDHIGNLQAPPNLTPSTTLLPLEILSN